MKKLSVLVVAAMLLSTGSLFANNGGKKDKAKKSTKTETKSLSSQIGLMLNNASLTEDEVGETAQVLFTLNSKGEIVVLSVDTDDATMETFIKSRLNYQEVKLNRIEEGKKYTVSVYIAS